PLWLLALITLSGTLAMHMFVHALPDAARALGATPAAMQMTISVYILGLAFGQLIYGPLSDRFGRRPTLMAGLGLYTAAGIAAACVLDPHSLIAARLVQALGGCAGLALGRAVVRDTAGAVDTARRLALMNLMVALGPGLAPILGGALTTAFGWRAVFIVLAALGLALILLTWRLLPETGNRGSATDLATLGRNYRGLLASPAFLGFALGGGCATTSMYAFVASAPFIFTRELGRPEHEVGFYLAVLIGGVLVGSVLTSRLIPRLPLGRVLVGANLVSVLASFVLLAVTLLGGLTVWWAVGTMFAFTIGAGIASPTALTRAVDVDPRVTGSASGLYGFAQMAVGAVCTTLAGLGSDPAVTTAVVLVGAGMVAQVSFWLALRS
ncbi:MAG: multidrug effflux MFS transporter, partial [Parvibaculaceae bacterium]